MDYDFDLPDLMTGFDDSADNVTHEHIALSLKLERKAARREFVTGLRHEALIQLIPALPAPDSDVFIISTGDGAQGRQGRKERNFDFGDFLPHAQRLLGHGCTAYLSTWCCNHDHAQTMLDMLKSGQLDRFTFFSDPYFMSRTPAIATTLFNGLAEYPDRARWKLFKNHTKIIALESADGQRHCTVMGSANLNMQPRAENYILTTAPDVFAWSRDSFFEPMLTRKERSGIQRRNRGK